MTPVSTPINNATTPIQGRKLTAREEKLLRDLQSIPQGQCNGIGDEQTYLNRYENIFAAEITRVRLTPPPSTEEWKEEWEELNPECYINANYCLNGTVILTQGPLNDRQKDYDWHHRDFYNMIWENGSEAVVMLTNYQENGEEKCSRYLPSHGPKLAGEYTITAEKVKEWLGAVLTQVKITKEQESRTFIHYHYTDWADHQVASVQAIAQLVRTLLNRQYARPVIHCSAGAGRSGTLAAVMEAYFRVQQNPTGDVDEALKKALTSLRRERLFCVQNLNQYVMARDVLQALLDEDRASTP